MARERKFSTKELFQATKLTLLQHGYDGTSFSLIADQMEVSRGALYKYYKNKDELIIDYMIYEMGQFLLDLRGIDQDMGFEAQFDYLMDTILKHSKIHQILGMTSQIATSSKEGIIAKKNQLNRQHIEAYQYLQRFIDLGKKEQKLKSHIGDHIILGVLLQSISIPNYVNVPQSEWIQSIKEIIKEGMFTTNN